FLAVAGAGMKVSLPAGKGTFSVNQVITMIGLLELGMPEVLLLAMAGAVTQTLWPGKPRKVRVAHVLFNVSSTVLTVWCAAVVFHRQWFQSFAEGELLRLTIAGVAYCLVNMSLVATILTLAEQQSFAKVWKGFSNWAFFYYLVAVALAEVVHLSTRWL